MTAPTELRPRRYVVDAGADVGRLSLWVYDVGLACCAVEFLAAAVGVGSADCSDGAGAARPLGRRISSSLSGQPSSG